MAKKRSKRVASEFSAEHATGAASFSKFSSKNKVEVTAVEVAPGRFPSCPICLAPNPEAAEHLPPKSMGGVVMTWTCQRCNNDFGTAEEELRRYLELEVKVQAEAPGAGPVRGRRSATVALRSTPGRPPGAFVKSAAPDFNDLLISGASQLRVAPLDMDLVRAAALKQAYLAACLHLRAVPTSGAVEGARRILLAARDRDALSLRCGLAEFAVEAPRWIEAEDVPPVMLIEPASDVAAWLFAFAGRFTTPWPFADVRPLHRPPVA